MNNRLIMPKSLKADLVSAVHDQERIQGLTHAFYRYPARFSPRFAATVIRSFSATGDVVLDPFMGGGTAVVESLAAGRRVVGNDLNPLAVFVTRAKTATLSDHEQKAVQEWGNRVVPTLNYRLSAKSFAKNADPHTTKNLHLPRARFIKKIVAAAIASLRVLPTETAEEYARCAILKTSQWALDGKKTHTTVAEFRQRLEATVSDMLNASKALDASRLSQKRSSECVLLHGGAENLHEVPCFSTPKNKASLVVTSPPYPGVHVLYHRWQVDGRRETPAPYWIAGCNDGAGASFYNFGDRREKGLRTYFQSTLNAYRSIRQIVKEGAIIVQLVAFSDPSSQLPRYLRVLKNASFSEVSVLTPRANASVRRIWRQVPNRKWHASIKGGTHSSREVVLIHRAD